MHVTYSYEELLSNNGYNSELKENFLEFVHPFNASIQDLSQSISFFLSENQLISSLPTLGIINSGSPEPIFFEKLRHKNFTYQIGGEISFCCVECAWILL